MKRIHWLAWAGTGICLACASAQGGDLRLSDDIDAEYKLTINYSALMRLKQPDSALVDGPVDATTKLPSTANYDDGDRNFKARSLGLP